MGDRARAQTLGDLAEAYLYRLRVRNYAQRTIENHESYLRLFVEWAQGRMIVSPAYVTIDVLEDYQSHVFEIVKSDGKQLSANAQHARLVPLRAYFSFMTRRRHINANPAADLELPKLGRPLPKGVMNDEEVSKVFEQVDLSAPTGLRDLAIMHVAYATGLRRAELCRLELHGIDRVRGVVTVRKGKGNKDRIVPILEEAIALVDEYIETSRPDPAPGHENVLFLTVQGRRITENRMTQLVRDYIRAADIGDRGSCHAFRHSIATAMLDNGADLRHVQAQLGHADISTTQIYTQVSVAKLKAVHTATHPLARRRPPRREESSVSVEEPRSRRH
jgi:integrase/recombinase XerD